MAVALNLFWIVPLTGCVGGGRHTVTPNNSSLSAIDTAQALALQSAVMSMSDDWNSALGAMAFEMQRACGSDMECMWVTQAFLRNGMGASLDVAVGPNPSVAIMDMLVLCSLETWALEHHWAGVGIPLEAGLAGAKQLANARDALWEQAADHLKVAELARLRALVDAEPIYETMPGWTTPTKGATRMEQLPAEARRYIERLEAVTGVPCAIISTGSDRDETIVRADSVVAQWL